MNNLKLFHRGGNAWPKGRVRMLEERIEARLGETRESLWRNVTPRGGIEMIHAEDDTERLERCAAMLTDADTPALMRKLKEYDLIGKEPPPAWVMEIICTEIVAERRQA